MAAADHLHYATETGGGGVRSVVMISPLRAGHPQPRPVSATLPCSIAADVVDSERPQGRQWIEGGIWPVRRPGRGT